MEIRSSWIIEVHGSWLTGVCETIAGCGFCSIAVIGETRFSV